jgi:hypothetical protein
MRQSDRVTFFWHVKNNWPESFKIIHLGFSPDTYIRPLLKCVNCSDNRTYGNRQELCKPSERTGYLFRDSSVVYRDYDGSLLNPLTPTPKAVFCLLNVEFSSHVWDKMVEREVMDSNFLAF